MGTGVALVTPFNSNGSVDYNSLEKIVDLTINGGVDYLVILGTTSESPTLSEKRKEKIFYIVKKNNRRVPLVIGIGGNNTNNLIDRIKKINDSSFPLSFQLVLIIIDLPNLVFLNIMKK